MKTPFFIFKIYMTSAIFCYFGFSLNCNSIQINNYDGVVKIKKHTILDNSLVSYGEIMRNTVVQYISRYVVPRHYSLLVLCFCLPVISLTLIKFRLPTAQPRWNSLRVSTAESYRDSTTATIWTATTIWTTATIWTAATTAAHASSTAWAATPVYRIWSASQ